VELACVINPIDLAVRDQRLTEWHRDLERTDINDEQLSGVGSESVRRNIKPAEHGAT